MDPRRSGGQSTARVLYGDDDDGGGDDGSRGVEAHVGKLQPDVVAVLLVVVLVCGNRRAQAPPASGEAKHSVMMRGDVM